MTDIMSEDVKKNSDKRAKDGKVVKLVYEDEEDDEYTDEERSLYWTGFSKSNGFDLEGLMNKSNRPPFEGFKPHHIKRSDDCPTEVILYAKLGIHWYNMMQGKNLQLNCVEKYNHRNEYLLGCTRLITCVATDPKAASHIVFQTGIRNEITDVQRICCFTATPKGGVEKPVEPSYGEELPWGYNYGDTILPKWPSARALRDKTRYYSVKRSDLPKHDWIRLYLEIFFHANWKFNELPLKSNGQELLEPLEPDLTKLLILRVVVQSRQQALEPPAERLNAINSVIYIKYKHPSSKAVRSLNPPRNRIAVIKRTLDKRKGQISLFFDPLYEDKLHL